VTSAAAYDVRSLLHAYNGKPVLDVPRLEIQEGEICVLSGPNGSGKTTLLSILALLRAPTSGSVRLRGVETIGNREHVRLRRQVTLIHQKPFLFAGTVWGNVSYGLRALGRPSKEIKARVGGALEELGLLHLADKPAGELSGGEAQRVVLARGLVLETPLLLLDEPSSFLDESFRPLLFDMLRRANQTRAATILVASHDPNLDSSLAHRVIILDGGKVRAVESAGGTR
jgi:tungstate transport system ATP-binding protein